MSCLFRYRVFDWLKRMGSKFFVLLIDGKVNSYRVY